MTPYGVIDAGLTVKDGKIVAIAHDFSLRAKQCKEVILRAGVLRDLPRKVGRISG